jgi:hypothetical protein
MKGADLGPAMLAVILTLLTYGCASRPDLDSLACVLNPL